MNKITKILTSPAYRWHFANVNHKLKRNFSDLCQHKHVLENEKHNGTQSFHTSFDVKYDDSTEKQEICTFNEECMMSNQVEFLGIGSFFLKN